MPVCVSCSVEIDGRMHEALIVEDDGTQRTVFFCSECAEGLPMLPEDAMWQVCTVCRWRFKRLSEDAGPVDGSVCHECLTVQPFNPIHVAKAGVQFVEGANQVQ